MPKEELSAQEILKKPYARILIPEEDGTYSAELLEFPGCFAAGSEPTEAIAELESAAASWIEATREQNREIPEPLASHGYSGKLNLRLPKSFHRQAARFARREDVSLNHFLTSAIAASLGAEELADRLLRKLEHRIEQTALVVQTTSTYQFITVNPVANVFSSPRMEVFGNPFSWPAQPFAVDFPYRDVSVGTGRTQIQEVKADNNA